MGASKDFYYIGVDVGTGSARACVIDSLGEIKGLASEEIQLWKSSYGHDETHYEQSTTDIWNHICGSVRSAVAQAGIDASAVKGIGFDATCSLAVFSHDTDEPVTVTKSHLGNSAADTDDRNIILWLDHRALKETDAINATGHNLLRYVGGTMNVEMEMPKVLWLKNNMPAEEFSRCKFYDLADALTHMATGSETRSFCSTVCKQGFVPVGVDGSVKGWQEDFYTAVGLGELAQDNFKRVGGVNGVNGEYLSAGELVGPLSAKAAGQLGLKEGIAVGSGVIDAYAGWIGTVGAPVDLGDKTAEAAGTHNPHDVSQAFTRLAAVAGTSTCHLAMSPNPVFVEGVWGPYRDVMLPEYWMAEGGQSATGELIRHVVETHTAFDAVTAKAKDAGANIYDYLNTRLRALATEAGSPAVPHLARHLFFYGDLWGNRSPVADPHMRGALVGMSHTDAGEDGLALLYYAALEFIALQTRQIVDTMNESGHNLRSVFMSGSQCRNDLLVGLIATSCNMPVVIPRYDNAAVVHGAAMLGAKAASGTVEVDDGKTEPLWTIMTRMTKAGRIVQPSGNAGEAKLLQAKYQVMLDQLRTQREYRNKVNSAIAGWEK